jgi:hypothetical protein
MYRSSKTFITRAGGSRRKTGVFSVGAAAGRSLLLRYLSHAPGGEGFWRKTSSGGATKYCVKKTGYMAHG